MPESQRFRVSLTPAVMLGMAVLLRRAMIFGHSVRLAACLERIDDELANRPLDWGEASSNLTGADMVVCTGFNDRVRVEFLVHPDARPVFVTVIEPQSGHPLFVPPDA